MCDDVRDGDDGELAMKDEGNAGLPDYMRIEKMVDGVTVRPHEHHAYPHQVPSDGRPCWCYDEKGLMPMYAPERESAAMNSGPHALKDCPNELMCMMSHHLERIEIQEQSGRCSRGEHEADEGKAVSMKAWEDGVYLGEGTALICAHCRVLYVARET